MAAGGGGGAGVLTVNALPLLATPPTVTTTLPVVAPDGTGTAMLDADQLVGVARVPLNVTVLVPLVDPKFDPAIVTAVPTGPVAGVSDTIFGAGVLPPLPDFLNAANTKAQRLLALRAAVADTAPADA